MKILYIDEDIIVCIKPARVLSTDEPGGLPDLLRQELNLPDGDIRTVHRLDRVVSGVMILARNAAAASSLSRQIRDDQFGKEYLAIVHGNIAPIEGTLRDLLFRDKARRMTMVADAPGKGVQEAILDYHVLSGNGLLSRVLIRLRTGRTHQIRVQFASRGYPLVGERKYAVLDDSCEIALWSHKIRFMHPTTNVCMTFQELPPAVYPWTDV